MKRWTQPYRHIGCSFIAKTFTGKAFRQKHTHNLTRHTACTLSSCWLQFYSQILYWQGFQAKTHPQLDTSYCLHFIVILAADFTKLPCSSWWPVPWVGMKRGAPPYRHIGCSFIAKSFTGKAFRQKYTHNWTRHTGCTLSSYWLQISQNYPA